MNPENRTLYKVTLEQLKDPNKTFSDLMGDDVEPRKRFYIKKRKICNKCRYLKVEEEFKNQNILGRDLVDEMEESYLSYAMSVIISRALPDVRDGLKPVHRRVLYGASGIEAQWNRKHKKSARIVGEVIGKYHPHGDQSIYDSSCKNGAAMVFAIFIN